MHDAQVTTTIDRGARRIAVRITGSREAVQRAVDRIGELCAERKLWVRFMGPVRWGDEYVAQGELRAGAESLEGIHATPPRSNLPN